MGGEGGGGGGQRPMWTASYGKSIYGRLGPLNATVVVVIYLRCNPLPYFHTFRFGLINQLPRKLRR